MLNYITWNVSPEVFNSGSFSIRWYGVLFACSFLLGYFVLSKIFAREKMLPKHVDRLTIYIFIGTIVGLRLGHCLFYEPAYYLSNPLEILKVWKGGLASHGAAIGILIALYLFARKTKKKYLWLLDRVVIIVVLVGAFIRIGNLMNSEIVGAETSNSHAFLFVNEFDRSLTSANKHLIDYTEIKQLGKDTVVDGKTYTQVEASIAFKANKINEQNIRPFIYDQVLPMIATDKDMQTNFRIFQTPEITFNEVKNLKIASFKMHAIPRHPSQIYEASAYFLMFVFLYILYLKKGNKLPNGFIFGLFLIVLWGFRFIIEYFKEVQVPFEQKLPLYMGQILSIPFIILGIIILFFAIKNKGKQINSTL